VPSLGADDALVTGPRILAVRAEPAEAKPGATITFTALVAGPEGTSPAPAIAWSFCGAPKPLTGDNVVSSACLGPTSLIPSSAGTSVAATTPSDSCSIFGPVSPPGGVRPRAPDGTGGYYQPLRADLAGSDPTFVLARITCDLANASAASATAFAKAYGVNQNPKLLPLAASIRGATARLTAIPAGERVDLTASWPAASAETYAYYDAASDAVITQREAMSVAWYASVGVLDRESTGRGDTDPGTTSDNRWTASLVGTAFLWIVLRDSRGGVDFAGYEVTVVP
jgi:hypothetical protein